MTWLACLMRMKHFHRLLLGASMLARCWRIRGLHVHPCDLK